MESATHPRATCGPACANLGITRVCVNSTKPLKNGPKSDKILESCPTRIALHDSVDSCVTNHRIVREHAGGFAPPLLAHASGQGARPSVAGPTPRPEARETSVDCTSARSNGRARLLPSESLGRSLALPDSENPQGEPA